jgi:hypothetical protein
MLSSIVRSANLALIAAIFLQVGPASFGQERDAVKGVDLRQMREKQIQSARKYRQRWAVIVGINYRRDDLSESDRKLVPKLVNAENDAETLANLLKTYYGYDEKHVRLLRGPEAKRDRIVSAIGDLFLANSHDVEPNDSILFFFSGHGDDGGGSAGQLFPWDVAIIDGKPRRETCIAISDVVKLVTPSPARHKLVILDCCHSGDVFSLAQQAFAPTSPLQHDAGLFETPAFGAIASCRKEQLASDGRNGHSPFAGALIKGLKNLPRQQGTLQPVLARDLFDFMQSELRDAPPVDQQPSYRALTTDQGEFHFIPDPTAEFPTDGDDAYDPVMKGIAMAPGTYGAWWFNEMPWFMPSLRGRILAGIEPTRGIGQQLTKRQLLSSAARVLAALETESTNALSAMRAKHLHLLLSREFRQDARAVYQMIIDDLEKPPSGVSLESADLHFLAVLEHRVGAKRERCLDAYSKALAQYSRRARQERDALLESLCHADFGEWRLQDSDFEPAAVEFQLALTKRFLCPIPFQVYVLCREAEAWQQLGRPGEANARIEQAINLSLPSPGQPLTSLTAFAWTRRAQLNIEQWNFSEAVGALNHASETLGATTIAPSDQEARMMKFQIDDAKAMIQRFTGRPICAAAQYRRLAIAVRKIYRSLRDERGVDRDVDVNDRLIERLVCSLEHRADCHLFGEGRLLKDASDDLRCASQAADYLPADRQPAEKAALCYKQALTLARRSPVKDLDLASAYLREADKATQLLSAPQQRDIQYLREVATGVVSVAVKRGDANAKSTPSQEDCFAIAQLRRTILALRPKLSPQIQRDELELLLLGANYLVTEDMGYADRYSMLTDAELLVRLCRYAVQSKDADALPYLRPHYDAAVRAMIAAQPKSMQGIIGAIVEATAGISYQDLDLNAPILAFYNLDEHIYAVFDVPSGISRIYRVGESISQEDGKETRRQLLQLPRQLLSDVADAKVTSALLLDAESLAAPHGPSTLLIAWKDRVRDGVKPDTHASKLPFELPGIRLPN